MTTQQAQDVVKAVYANARRDYQWSPTQGSIHYIMFGDKCLAVSHSEEQAWIKAANKITGKTIQP